MASLPEARLAFHMKHFKRELDYFGPFHIKIGHKFEKLWEASFICIFQLEKYTEKNLIPSSTQTWIVELTFD